MCGAKKTKALHDTLTNEIDNREDTHVHVHVQVREYAGRPRWPMTNDRRSSDREEG